jgi:hypothetical protein
MSDDPVDNLMVFDERYDPHPLHTLFAKMPTEVNVGFRIIKMGIRKKREKKKDIFCQLSPSPERLIY